MPIPVWMALIAAGHVILDAIDEDKREERK